MPILSTSQIAALLVPFFADGPAPADNHQLVAQLQTYLDLLLHWNARTNLTAIREPEAIVQRHFGESLLAARVLSPMLPPASTLLDFGSGAGFPGIPIQLYRPDLHVTLAESQGKKAAFLREAARSLNLPTEIWSTRAETMPPARQFNCVTLRAVDRMEDAMESGSSRVSPNGILALLAGSSPTHPTTLTHWQAQIFDIPQSDRRQLQLYRRKT